MKNLLVCMLGVMAACSGTPSGSSGDAGVAGASRTPSCGVPAWTNTVGALPAALPNQTPPGYIVAIVANGGPNLQVTYQDSFGTSITKVITAGDASSIGITGSWQQDGAITVVQAAPGGTSFKVNSAVFTLSGASVSGSAAWSGLNSGVGQIDGSGDTLIFTGYNANNGLVRGNLTFTGTCPVVVGL